MFHNLGYGLWVIRLSPWSRLRLAKWVYYIVGFVLYECYLSTFFLFFTFFLFILITGHELFPSKYN